MEVKPGYKQTEVGVIPEEWEVKSLGQIAQLKNGYAFKSETYDSLGDFKVVTIANVQDGFMDTAECSRIFSTPSDLQAHQRLSIGDILISMTGNVGRVCRVTEPSCLLNQRVGKLTPTDFDADLLFLLLSQRRFITSMATKAKGGAQGNLSITDITEFPFAIPPNDAEQSAIAEALSDVDGLLGGLDRLIAKKRDLKQAAMQQLLTGQTRLPGFHGEWDAPRLGSLFTFKNGLNKAKEFFGFGTPIVNYMDVYSKRGITQRDIAGRVSLSREELKNFEVRKGDVFFTRTSETADEVGITTVMLDEPQNTVFSGFVLRARPKDDSLDDQFKKFCFSTTSVRQQITSQSTETTRALTNGRCLSAVKIARPPKPEQTAIAEVLTEMDLELAALEQRREKTRALKQAMMQELLTGKTRLV